MHKVAIIAISGLAISAVSLGAAIAVGASHGGGGMTFGDNVACEGTGGAATTRQFAWDGDDAVSISAAARVHYTPGSGNAVIVKGDPELVGAVRVSGGRIEMSCRPHWHGRMLDITLPGRQFRAFDIGGLTELDLNHLSQDRLDLNLAGKSDITATGTVGTLKIQAAGKSEAHMKDLSVGKLSLTIMGKTDIETSPHDDASITIMGRGDIKLYSEPKNISTTIMGSGDIQHLARKS
jgi:hypothetical protein